MSNRLFRTIGVDLDDRGAPAILFPTTPELLVLCQPPVNVLFVIRQPGVANMDYHVRQRGSIRANQFFEFMLQK
jgi:hypothetical protein